MCEFDGSLRVNDVHDRHQLDKSTTVRVQRIFSYVYKVCLTFSPKCVCLTQSQEQMVFDALPSSPGFKRCPMSRPDGLGSALFNVKTRWPGFDIFFNVHPNVLPLLLVASKQRGEKVHLYTWWPFMSHDTPPANQSTNVLWKSFQLVNQTPLHVKLLLQMLGARFMSPENMSNY